MLASKKVHFEDEVSLPKSVLPKIQKPYKTGSIVLLANSGASDREASVDPHVRRGVIKYYGRLPGRSGKWYGIELLNCRGLNNGFWKSKKYFSCAKEQGVFVQESRILRVLKPILRKRMKIRLNEIKLDEENDAKAKGTEQESVTSRDLLNWLDFLIEDNIEIPILDLVNTMTNRYRGQIVKFRNEVKIVRLQKKSRTSSPVRPLRVWSDSKENSQNVDDDIKNQVLEFGLAQEIQVFPEMTPEVTPEILPPRVKHRGYLNLRNAIIDTKKPPASVYLEIAPGNGVIQRGNGDWMELDPTYEESLDEHQTKWRGVLEAFIGGRHHVVIDGSGIEATYTEGRLHPAYVACQLLDAIEYDHYHTEVKALSELEMVPVNLISPNRRRTFLILAVYHNDKAWAKELLQKGATTELISQWEVQGILPPFHLAAHLGNTQIVELLIEWGAEHVALRGDDERTPLSLARKQFHEPVVRLMLNYHRKERSKYMNLKKLFWRLGVCELGIVRLVMNYMGRFRLNEFYYYSDEEEGSASDGGSGHNDESSEQFGLYGDMNCSDEEY